LGFPKRFKNDLPRYDFRRVSALSFEEPDLKTFRNLVLSMEALNKGGNLPCVMNAANEIAVYGFMKNRLGFLDMTEVIEKTMEKISFIQNPTLTQYYESDAEAREYSASLINL
jgi:1-deoxy-D-xylulose-5-phosphate reductoisomerase